MRVRLKHYKKCIFAYKCISICIFICICTFIVCLFVSLFATVIYIHPSVAATTTTQHHHRCIIIRIREHQHLGNSNQADCITNPTLSLFSQSGSDPCVKWQFSVELQFFCIISIEFKVYHLVLGTKNLQLNL